MKRMSEFIYLLQVIPHSSTTLLKVCGFTCSSQLITIFFTDTFRQIKALDPRISHNLHLEFHTDSSGFKSASLASARKENRSLSPAFLLIEFHKYLQSWSAVEHLHFRLQCFKGQLGSGQCILLFHSMKFWPPDQKIDLSMLLCEGYKAILPA